MCAFLGSAAFLPLCVLEMPGLREELGMGLRPRQEDSPGPESTGPILAALLWSSGVTKSTSDPRSAIVKYLMGTVWSSDRLCLFVPRWPLIHMLKRHMCSASPPCFPSFWNPHSFTSSAQIKMNIPGLLAPAFNLSSWGAEAGNSLELEASLVYLVSFKPSRAT